MRDLDISEEDVEVIRGMLRDEYTAKEIHDTYGYTYEQIKSASNYKVYDNLSYMLDCGFTVRTIHMFCKFMTFGCTYEQIYKTFSLDTRIERGKFYELLDGIKHKTKYKDIGSQYEFKPLKIEGDN